MPMAASGTGVASKTKRIPVTPEDLNRFCEQMNNYIELLTMNIEDIKQWNRVSDIWEDITGGRVK